MNVVVVLIVLQSDDDNSTNDDDDDDNRRQESTDEKKNPNRFQTNSLKLKSDGAKSLTHIKFSCAFFLLAFFFRRSCDDVIGTYKQILNWIFHNSRENQVSNNAFLSTRNQNTICRLFKILAEPGWTVDTPNATNYYGNPMRATD